MFDIGFTELLLIAVVALVVLGPERLPKAARFTGLWVRRARAQWFSVKSELERELAAEELKRSLHDAKQAAARLQDTMRETEDEVQAKVREAEAEARREIESLRRQTSAAPRSSGGASSSSDPALEDAPARRFDAPPGAAELPAPQDAADGATPAPPPADASPTAADSPHASSASAPPADAPRQPDLPGVTPATETDPDDGRRR